MLYTVMAKLGKTRTCSQVKDTTSSLGNEHSMVMDFLVEYNILR